ncbi:MAG: hypothetical protein FJZ75_07685 [Bacteroidetes bacterium]|nr:hypothetical protein [Bacteroidota bacterium]
MNTTPISPPKHTIRAFVATLFNAFPITTNYEYPSNLANTTYHSCIRGYPF